jgi:UDPglucose 6-dehydrogenase
MWGLSFKPGTDDIREASSIDIINELISLGATIKAFDPVAMEQAGKELPVKWFESGRLMFEDNQYKAIENTDALILVTEWKTFRQPDFKLMADAMKELIIFDGRNQYEPEEVKEMGFEYHGIGREKVNSFDI